MTDFVVSVVKEAAQRAIQEHQLMRLSLADQMCFAQAPIAPAEPSQALKRAFARRHDLLGAELNAARFRFVPLNAAHDRPLSTRMSLKTGDNAARQ